MQLLSPSFVKGTHVVNIITMGGVQGSVKFPGLSAYCSSKAALANLTELLAVEWESLGIKVNALAIGRGANRNVEGSLSRLPGAPHSSADGRLYR